MNFLTSDEYIKTSASCCPACSSALISGDRIEFHSGSAVRDVYCEDCEKQWAENFEAINEVHICSCGCSDLDYGEQYTSGVLCSQKVSCPDCENTWNNEYELKGYELI